MNNKLSNNEELVVRLLYTNQYDSDMIPSSIFTEGVKERLLDYNLIVLNTDGKYILTGKAKEIIETNGFVVVYPLANEQGVVTDYNKTLESMSNDAIKALGLSIINTRQFTRWGKLVNIMLYNNLISSFEYYRNHEHPIEAISQYKLDVDMAQGRLDRELDKLFRSVKNYRLPKPIKIAMVDEDTVYLTEIISHIEFKIKVGNKEQIVNNAGGLYYISSGVKELIIKGYYK